MITSHIDESSDAQKSEDISIVAESEDISFLPQWISDINNNLNLFWQIVCVGKNKDQLYFQVKQKTLEHELYDNFEDLRIGAVMRGDKILCPKDFWEHIFKNELKSIQHIFQKLNFKTWVNEAPPSKEYTILYGDALKMKSVKTQQISLDTKKPKHQKPKKRFTNS